MIAPTKNAASHAASLSLRPNFSLYLSLSVFSASVAEIATKIINEIAAIGRQNLLANFLEIKMEE
jgi:hypothetical protein